MLRLAIKGSDGKWTKQYVAGHAMPFMGSYGFYANLKVNNGQGVLSTYAINQQLNVPSLLRRSLRRQSRHRSVARSSIRAMDMGLTGRRAFVAGSSSGIGRAVAAGLLAEGANVVVNGRNADKLERTRKELEASSARACTPSWPMSRTATRRRRPCARR